MAGPKVSVDDAPPNLVAFVAHVLRCAEGKLVTFSVGGYSVTPPAIRKVGELVSASRNPNAKDKITVYVIKGASDFNAGYVDKGGSILLNRWGSKEAYSDARLYRAAIVHEAVHAVFDLQGADHPFTMSTFIDEEAAYIGEAIYLVKQGFLASEFASQTPPLRAAHGVAREILVHGRYDPADPVYRHFKQAVFDLYKGGPKHKRKDGVN